VFNSWTSLGNVTIPDSVLRIGNEAFNNCTSLAAITVDALNPVYSSAAGVLFDKSQTTLVQYPCGKEGSDYIVPRSVTNINDMAFAYCISLTGVHFPSNAPSLAGSNVFYADNSVVIYYLPGTTGWTVTLGGRPTALWLLPNPRILNFESNFGVQTNGFGFTVSWATNVSIVVQACTNLSNPNWQPVLTNTLVSGSAYFRDPQWTKYPSRFYRLRSW
jgi:hypothetical protein